MPRASVDVDPAATWTAAQTPTLGRRAPRIPRNGAAWCPLSTSYRTTRGTPENRPRLKRERNKTKTPQEKESKENRTVRQSRASSPGTKTTTESATAKSMVGTEEATAGLESIIAGRAGPHGNPRGYMCF